MNEFLWKLRYIFWYWLNHALDDAGEYFTARGLNEPSWIQDGFWWTKEKLEPFIMAKNDFLPPSLPRLYYWMYGKYDFLNDKAAHKRWEREEKEHPFVPTEGVGGFLVPAKFVDELNREIMHRMLFHLERTPGFSQTILPKDGETPTEWHPDMDFDVTAPREPKEVQPNSFEFGTSWPSYLREIYQETHNDLPPPIDTSTS